MALRVSPATRPATGDTGDTPHPADFDALRYPVALWADLPIPASLVVLCRDRRVWLTASRWRAQDARGRGEPVFGPSEYESAAAAVLDGRATTLDVIGWVGRKTDQPGWSLDPREAVAGALGLVEVVGDPKGAHRWRVRPELLRGVTWGRALEAMGLRLERCVVETPAAQQTEAAVVAALGGM